MTIFRRRSDGSDDVRIERTWNRGGGPSDWARDGSELFYLAHDTVTVVKTSLDAERPAATPRVLFTAGSTDSYAGSPDGERLLVIEGERNTAESAVVVMHWAAGLRR